jgi:hypothetical protein
MGVLRRLVGRPINGLALAGVVYLAAGVIATVPAVGHIGSAFMSGGASGHGEAAAGDHLQTSYHLWLVGDQLQHGHLPWLDPYSFRPEADPTINAAGWPFGFPYWPLQLLFGTVLAWNLFVLLSFVAAGLLTRAWLRQLGLPSGAALAGGLAFAIAPYRVEQTVGHLLGPISMMLPLMLFAFERGRRGTGWWYALSAAALASIPLSGQVHLALGAIPFFALYVLCRTRDRKVLAGAAWGLVAAVAAGILIREAVIVGSVDAGGRSLAEVTKYSADGLDFLTRHERHGSESFVFLGWLTPFVAIAGLALLVRARRTGLAVVLGVGALVPLLLALGTNLPIYSTLWHHVSPFRYPRVPERLMPIACLALAALVAFAVAELARLRPGRREAAIALAVVALVADLHVKLFGSSAADAGNKAYAALKTQAPGQLLELPVFLPDVHLGSVYLYYDMQVKRQRPGGYSTTAPVIADSTARRLRYLNCGDWTGGQDDELRGLGADAIAFHEGLYENNPIVHDPPWFAWRALLEHGFRPIAKDGAITMFARRGGPAPSIPVPEPSHTDAIFCEGWTADADGHQMSQGHSPFWIYGYGRLRLFVKSAPSLLVQLSVDGVPIENRQIAGLSEIKLPLGRIGWHLISFDGPLALVDGRRLGARLVAYSLK